MTSDRDIAAQALLESAFRSAGDVIRDRLARPLNVGQGSAPDTNALLRFDVQFGEAARLNWFISNADATGFADVLIGGSGDREAVLTEQHLDALSNAFSGMIERSIDAFNASLDQPLTSTAVDMGMEGALPPEADGNRIVLGFDIDGLGPVTIVQDVNAAFTDHLREHITATSASPHQGNAAPSAGESDNVVQLPHVASDDVVREPGDIRMLMNVPLQVTVELGRTQQSVGELLDLNVGSIIELAKLAGDPLDIMVNGKVLARGEVVVIEEEFGIRVTEILSPEDRIKRLG